MKKLSLLILLFIISFVSLGQDISDVSQSKSGRLTVLDSKNHEISYKYISSGDELSGFSSTIIVITSKSHRVTVYNQKFSEISYKYISDGDYVKNVSGNNIIIKSKGGRITIYDKNFHEISYRY